MASSVQRFIDRLAASSAGLQAARADAGSVSVGREAVAPLTLMALGQRLAEDMAGSGGANDAVFEAIEEAFVHDDPQLSEAASRVIEAAVGRAVDLGNWPELREKLGERSGEHALTCMALDR